MRYDVHITEVSTGDTQINRSFDTEWDGDYMWSLGNYACDCNRAIFHYGAAHPELTPHQAYMKSADIAECGEGRFRVRILSRDTGEVLYEDEAPAP